MQEFLNNNVPMKNLLGGIQYYERNYCTTNSYLSYNEKNYLNISNNKNNKTVTNFNIKLTLSQ